ncbi:hypothetical protein N7532_004337 [Penicillium argentinense]|uniref:Zn(2)-C6 fungal-type domain-containing protein n=1 Tax=Penicillium argentinense TaxID=1131581 RepID=A0A9W9FP64_9EURO|nr:uncharacterized protein N7532_004337 [Penicillium argentinense]KAJ5103808.1 hypothetical protein N7532_004337 [Penicillium argentinense]
MSISPSAQSRHGSVKPLRSKLGCKTCKIRRVKCGEEKPNCLRCTSTGRNCEYQNVICRNYSDSTVSILSNPLSLFPNTVWRERRAFAYYFQFAAESIGGGLDVDFWRTIVPQVCRSESAIWDAMIAISSLFESPDLCPDLGSLRRGQYSHALNQNHQDALDWYSRAVSAVRQGIERGGVDAFVGLITCVLFICIETLLGGVQEALRLYGQGINLIHTLRAQAASGAVGPTKLALLKETLIPIFVRLGAVSLHSVWALASTLVQETEDVYAPQPEFISLRSARDAIVILATEIPLFEGQCEEYLKKSHRWQISEEMMHQRAALTARLEGWHTAFSNFMKWGLLSSQIGTGALLLTYYEMLSVMLAVCMSPSRITTDSCLHNFQNIVEQGAIALNASARQDGTLPPFTFELGIGLPLWFTCLRCRQPELRRTALALLRRTHRIYGLYKRDQGAALSEVIMTLEEKYAMEMNAAQGMISSSLGVLDSKPISSPSPLMELETKSSARMLIPQEARIRPHDVFRPSDGYPPGVTEKDLVKWKRGRGQYFMQFSWNQYDRSSNTWTMIFDYVPIGFS